MSDEAKRKMSCPACRGDEGYHNDDGTFEECATCEGDGWFFADALLEDWKGVIRVYKQIRQTHDLTLGFLAGVTGIKVSALSDIERGFRFPTNGEWDSIREAMPDLPHNWLNMKDYKPLSLSGDAVKERHGDVIDMPERDETVIELDEVFHRLTQSAIKWEVKSLSRAGDGFVPWVEVGGFTIHLSEGDLTTDKLLTALKEGYDRVVRYRDDQRQNPPKLHKPEVKRDGKK